MRHAFESATVAACGQKCGTGVSPVFSLPIRRCHEESDDFPHGLIVSRDDFHAAISTGARNAEFTGRSRASINCC